MNNAAGREWPDVALLIMLAAFVYQPWAATALPLADFGTFLPLLDRDESIWAQVVTVTKFYMAEGRICIFPYLLFVFAANAFDVWAPGWHWTYFGLNAAVVVAGWLVLRKTGVPRLATFLALAFWATMAATTEVWLRPTGEPMALLFFLTALYFGINYTQAGDWKRRAFVIGACCVGIMFSKEMLVVLLPAGWIVTRLRLDGDSWRWAPWSERDNFLLVVAGGAVLASAAPIGFAALTAPAGNYASMFGTASSTLALFLERLEIVLLPTPRALNKLAQLANDPGWIFLLILPSLLWIRLVAGGIWGGRRRIAWPLVIAGVWAILGVASYIPWPEPHRFYMMPFAFGAMFGAAHALRWAMQRGGLERAGVIACSLLLISISVVESGSIVRRALMRAQLTSAAVDEIASGPVPDYLVAAVGVSRGKESWSWSSHLEGFTAFARGVNIPRSSDLTCDGAREALASNQRVVVVTRDRMCSELSGSSMTIEKSTYRSQWPWLWERHVVSGRVYVTRSNDLGPPMPARASAVRAVEAPI